MAAHRLGAERVQLVVRPSSAAGLGRGAPMRLPVGRVHAMDEHGHAACGHPGELHDFGPWRSGPYTYCRPCEQRAPLPAGSP
ncbi:MAG: hypothetical protein NVSMB13_01490 [Mycobacteriales bacterium]